MDDFSPKRVSTDGIKVCQYRRNQYIFFTWQRIVHCKLVDFPVCILSLNKLTPFHYINDIFGRNISLTVKKFFNAVFAILNTDKKWKKMR